MSSGNAHSSQRQSHPQNKTVPAELPLAQFGYHHQAGGNPPPSQQQQLSQHRQSPPNKQQQQGATREATIASSPPKSVSQAAHLSGNNNNSGGKLASAHQFPMVASPHQAHMPPPTSSPQHQLSPPQYSQYGPQHPQWSGSPHPQHHSKGGDGIGGVKSGHGNGSRGEARCSPEGVDQQQHRNSNNGRKSGVVGPIGTYDIRCKPLIPSLILLFKFTHKCREVAQDSHSNLRITKALFMPSS